MNEHFKRGQLVSVADLVPGSVVNIKGFSCMYEGTKDGKTAIFTKRMNKARGAFVFKKMTDSFVYLCHEPEFEPLNGMTGGAGFGARFEPLTHTSLMPFGKYKDRTMQTVPASYLIFLYENNYLRSGPVKDYVEKNLSVIKSEIK